MLKQIGVARFRPQGTILAACAASLVGLAAGCSPTSTPEQAIKRALADAGQTQEAVYPFGGTVTVDGHPPQGDGVIVVMLNNTSKPNVPVSDRPYVECEADGKFYFSTYLAHDGVPAGKYVLTFAEFSRASGGVLVGPDKFENRFNDPDRNAADPSLAIDHAAPGKSDYVIDLDVKGRSPGTPGPHALLKVD